MDARRSNGQDIETLSVESMGFYLVPVHALACMVTSFLSVVDVVSSVAVVSIVAIIAIDIATDIEYNAGVWLYCSTLLSG